MSVGVFPLMQQLLQFMYGKSTKIIRVSSVPSNTSREERGEAIVFTGYVIFFISTLKDERNEHTALRTISRVNLGYYLNETVLNLSLIHI